MIKLQVLIIAGLLIVSNCYAGTIYNHEKQILYFGGIGYFSAQPYEDRDRSLNNKIVKYSILEQRIVETYNALKIIGEMKMTPSGRNIAFTESWGDGKRVLTVVDGNLDEIVQLKDVIPVYEWSNDGRYLAYLTGKPLYDQRRSFEADGLWLYDVETKLTKKIDGKVGIGIRFSRSDGQLLYYSFAEGNRGSNIYDVTTKKAVRTESRGMDFSPSGDFYMSGGRYEDLSLYKKNNELVDWFGNQASKNAYWLNEHEVFIYYPPKSVVLDPFKKKVKREITDKIMGWSSDRKYVVVYKDKEAHIMELLTGELVHKIKLRK